MKSPGDAMGSQLMARPRRSRRTWSRTFRRTCRSTFTRQAARRGAGTSGRDHHAQRAVLRSAITWRRAHDRSGARTADAAWLWSGALHFHHGGHPQLSVGVLHPLHECSGNPVYTKPYGKTASDLVGLLELRRMDRRAPKLVLQEAGAFKPGAKWIVAEGADAAALTPASPSKNASMMPCFREDSQNGERLRPQQGYPPAAAVAGIRRQHEREVAAPAQR